MLKFILLLSMLVLASCAQITIEKNADIARSIGSTKTLPTPDWKFITTSLPYFRYVYTPFFIENYNDLIFYTGGAGSNPGNGVKKIITTLTNTKPLSEKIVVATGPDLKNYNYFRAPRIAKNGNEIWMLVETAGCYTGCDNQSYPKSLAAYHSLDNGESWRFIDFVKVNGSRYVSQWMAQTGLVWNPKGSPTLDLKNFENNRFVTIGENRDIMISHDGVNFKSIPMNHPFPKDRLVFASMAKTPYGFHMMTCANWSDSYYTTTIRHLFSKDLINWYTLESNSFLKNPNFYKGVHLSYDEKSDKLWAISTCGSDGPCTFVAYSTPKDYLATKAETPKSDVVPVGEYVYINTKTAMIIDNSTLGGIPQYKVRYANGSYESNLTKDKFVFPLKDYKRQGCFVIKQETICVGDPAYVNGVSAAASIVGINDDKILKFAFRFSDGTIDTGYPRESFTLP